MTKEEKQLLLKDLSGRLPYTVRCATFDMDRTLREKDDVVRFVECDNVVTEKLRSKECLMFYQVKPYLRPMSSMTKEEKNEYDNLSYGVCDFTEDTTNLNPLEKFMSWLNEHMFDYRGLIEKGLALKAPEGMYK